MWLFRDVPEFCSWVSQYSKTNSFFVLCNEEYNYEDYIEKCIVTKSVVFLTSQIQDIFKYRIMVNQFLFTLKRV